ncbi:MULTISPECIES: hypothetical protein [Bacillaceae]|uniref:Uncharacterized protein n=3 Tax=Bacillaceae TaxID=186817 RepID=A0A856M6I0_9BACI|nr:MULTISPECIES: hypothetical protein [Bacillaceae]AMK74845.1 hypothetical protein AWV81_22370 [Bacillus subtilis subsp. natto]API45228.1 hypothetical protein BSR08_22830 [Bacillus subtilis]API98527.1 hypothetical protein BKP58_22260 [Bacillus subtilis]ASB72375.1 hypothetical protein S100333_04516 [Bacillus subtilis subsp. subtilis]AVL07003.1 hypothetical protein BS21228_22150 [Bacillus subtilis]
MKNIKHIKKMRNSILFSVVWRLLFLVLYPVILGAGLPLIGLNLPSATLFILSFIGCMMVCLTIATHISNLVNIREVLKQYASIERELVGTYSIDAKVLDDMLDNTMKKYHHQRSFDRDYNLADLHAIEELVQEERNGKYFDKYLAHDDSIKDEIRMAVVPKRVAEDLLYSVFNSKTTFGITGRKYYHKWHMARLDEQLLPFLQEKQEKMHKTN